MIYLLILVCIGLFAAIVRSSYRSFFPKEKKKKVPYTGPREKSKAKLTRVK